MIEKNSKVKEKKENPIYGLKPFWEKQETQNVWLASTLHISRNFANFNFPPKLEKAKQEQLISVVFDAMKNSPEVESPIFLKAEEVGPLEKEFLLEHFLAQNGFHHAHGGEAFIIDKTGKFLGVVNILNHLQLQLTDTDQEIEKCWNRLIKIESHIGKSIDYAFNSRFGFLNANPARSGTGLVIALFLHIPAIIHMGDLPELLEREKEEEIEATGLQGSPREMIGDILIARNSCSLGLTEEYILTSLRMWATRAVVAEVTLRKKLRENGDEQLKNKVARALGMITHSYQLEAVEALNALSLVKLGVDLGWIQAPPQINLNQAFFNSRRAHLMHYLGKKLEIPELPRQRAEYLQKIAKDLMLVI